MALKDTPVCDFGWKAPDFTLADPTGAQTSFADALTPKGLLVMFICNHCPFVVDIAERLAADTKLLMDEGLGVVAIMSNDYRDYPEDSPENMLAFAKRHGFPFPYLVDQDQAVGRSYGAVCTPDFFGFNGEGALQYRGRLDNLRMGDRGARTPELLSAMRQIGETGTGPQEQVPSMGCSIKWR